MRYNVYVYFKNIKLQFKKIFFSDIYALQKYILN